MTNTTETIMKKETKPEMKEFLDILEEMDPDEQKAFFSLLQGMKFAKGINYPNY